MDVMLYVKRFVVALVLVLICDFIWLGLLMKGFYASELGHLGTLVDGALAVKVGLGIIAWVLLALGAVLLVLRQSVDWKEAAIYGAVFGFIVYGVYDFTNFAVLQGWTWTMTLVDIVWGTVLFAFVSAVTKKVVG